jgi:hypothetical protein
MHRSGTTLLYEMLTHSGCWNTLWSWHVISYDEIEVPDVDLSRSQSDLLRRFADAGIESRGVDAVAVQLETKEEYGFILDNRRQGAKITRKNYPLFQQICRSVQRTFPDQKPLLLKNPWDFGNAPLIKELIPSARFVYIHRPPEEAVSSMWKFLNQVFLERNEYLVMLSTRYADLLRTRVRLGMLRWVIRHCPAFFVKRLIGWFGKCCDRYLKSIGQVSDTDKIEVTYDQLCGAPNETIGAILHHLGVQGANVDYATMIERRGGKIAEIVKAHMPAIERRFASYRKRIQEIESTPISK